MAAATIVIGDGANAIPDSENGTDTPLPTESCPERMTPVTDSEGITKYCVADNVDAGNDTPSGETSRGTEEVSSGTPAPARSSETPQNDNVTTHERIHTT